MKKIILSLVLAAAAFNGWLAASGSASLSTSELKVDDVEMVAEANEFPYWVVIAIAYEIIDEGFTHHYWDVDESYREAGKTKWICSYSWLENKPCIESSILYLSSDKNPNRDY